MKTRDFLEPLTGEAKRKRFLVFDLESKAGPSQKPGFTRPFLAGFYDGDTFKAFRNYEGLLTTPWRRRHTELGGCVDRFLRHLLRHRYRNTVTYAHFGGNFDFLFLLPWLEAHPEYEFRIVPIQSSIQSLVVWLRGKKKGGTWTFLDSYKLVPLALQKLLTTFGLEGKTEIDLSLHEEDPLWFEYLERDCRGLYEGIEKVHELVESLGGEVGMTTPSTSMKLFRRRYLGRGVSPETIPRHLHFDGCRDRFCHGCLHEWIRQGYCGGRTEIFEMMGKRLRYFDRNSSYPASMSLPMPAGGRVESSTYDRSMSAKYIGFVECTVEIPPECHIPPLPFRGDSGKLLFPAGRFSGVWSSCELELLNHPLVQGHIVHVKRAVWFRKQMVFFDMVEDLYAYRDKKRSDYDAGMSEMAKLMLNSLYGKFGMKEEREEIVILQAGKKPPIGSKPAGGNVDSRVWYAPKRTSPSYVIPQIAAHITALSRVALWLKMAEVLEKGGKLFYLDTDSILTDVELDEGSELGEWKNEFPGETLSAEFIQPKVYMLEKESPFPKEHEKGCRKEGCEGCANVKMAMKGLPKAERTAKNLVELKRGGKVRFRRLEKVRSMAREGFKKPPKMVTVEKSFASHYDKREVMPDGSTRSLVLGLTMTCGLGGLEGCNHEEAAE